MKHLDFVNEIEKSGVRLSSTNFEGKIKRFEIPGIFKNRAIISKAFKLAWEEPGPGLGEPIKELLKKAVDSGSWKHSWHIEMVPENYEKIEEIIQKKIIDKAKEIDELSSIYFQLHYEMSSKL